MFFLRRQIERKADMLTAFQAPVPYMNRALAKEALGVEAATSGDTASAADLYRDALQVPSFSLFCHIQQTS